MYHSNRYLDSGACYDGNAFRRCAMVPEECLAGETYVEHDQSERTMNRCDPNDAKIGRCLKENTCALRSTDCVEDTSELNFDGDDQFCTNQRDKSLVAEPWDVNNPTYTMFGSCKDTSTNEHFCIYNPEDCDSETEVYATPGETVAAGVQCDCSQVHVYGCEILGRVMCAVRADACNDRYTVLTPHEQRLNRTMGVNALDCKLCIKRNTPSPTPSPTTKTVKPTTFPTKLPTEATAGSPGISNITSPVEFEMDATVGITDATIIGGLCAGAGVILVVLGIIYWKLFRSIDDRKIDTKRNDYPPPPMQITIG